jgi:hypothetical protein
VNISKQMMQSLSIKQCLKDALRSDVGDDDNEPKWGMHGFASDWKCIPLVVLPDLISLLLREPRKEKKPRNENENSTENERFII